MKGREEKETLTMRVHVGFKDHIRLHLLPEESLTDFILTACYQLCDKRTEYAKAIQEAREKFLK